MTMDHLKGMEEIERNGEVRKGRVDYHGQHSHRKESRIGPKERTRGIWRQQYCFPLLTETKWSKQGE